MAVYNLLLDKKVGYYFHDYFKDEIIDDENEFTCISITYDSKIALVGT